MKDLWVEKYRPSSIDTYVFRDDNQHRQVAGWLEDGALPICCLAEQSVQVKQHLQKCCYKNLMLTAWTY